MVCIRITAALLVLLTFWLAQRNILLFGKVVDDPLEPYILLAMYVVGFAAWVTAVVVTFREGERLLSAGLLFGLFMIGSAFWRRRRDWWGWWRV